MEKINSNELYTQIEQLTDYEEFYSDELKSKKVEITISCATYNHVKYIRKTLEGFVKQKLNVGYEIVVFDDASNDGTSDIVREYATKYPGLIRAIIAKTNTYSHSKRKEVMAYFKQYELRGKYIALCEGDDYWLYQDKLQVQYELMERMPNVSLCFHNAIRFDETAGEVIPQIINMDSGVVDADEIFSCAHGRPATASFLFRHEYWCNIPHFFMTSPVGDDPLRFWCAFNGDVYYIDKCWSVRNYMHEGSWNSSIKCSEDIRIKFYTNYLKYMMEFNIETHKKFNYQVQKMDIMLCDSLLNCKNIRRMTKKELSEWCEECRCIQENLYDECFEQSYKKYVKYTIDYFDDIREAIIKSKKSKIIYGAGDFGRRLLHYMLNMGIKVDMFCQTNVSYEYTVENIPVISLKNLISINEDYQIMIAIADNKVSADIKEELLASLGNNCEIYEMGDYIKLAINM